MTQPSLITLRVKLRSVNYARNGSEGMLGFPRTVGETATGTHPQTGLPKRASQKLPRQGDWPQQQGPGLLWLRSQKLGFCRGRLANPANFTLPRGGLHPLNNAANARLITQRA